MSARIGRYLLQEEIAAGGMGSVHLGRLLGPAGFSRTVAVKRVHPHLAAGGELAAALLEEGRVSARIQHPFVVQTLDVVTEGGELAIILEYVHGVSLAQLVRALGGAPVPPRLAATILAQVLRGLHAAHEVRGEDGIPLELVHRDVSPQNVLVSAEGIARVLDFGIAKALGRASTTREGELKGKLAYMAPEQVNASAVDRRTDVFAAAIVLWELLTGARLFGGDDPKVTFAKVLRCEIPPPTALRPELDPALEAIVLRGLAVAPDDRWPTALAMALALEAWSPALPTAEVGAWVESLAGAVLTERRVRIAALEQGAPPADGGGMPSAEARTVTSAEASAAVTSLARADADEAEPRPRAVEGRGVRWAVVGLGLLSVAATGAVLALRRGDAARGERGADGRDAGGTAMTVAAAPSTTGSAAAAPAIVASHTPAAGSAAPAVAATISAVGAGKARARPVASAVPAAAAKPDCRDPYYLDAEGKRRYRRECLTP